jgi:hypothetical protein
MKYKIKWDVERYPHLCDYILQLLNAGLNRDQTYWAVANHLLLKNKDERQAIADQIAQLDSINVFTKGRIPKDLDRVGISINDEIFQADADIQKTLSKILTDEA